MKKPYIISILCIIMMSFLILSTSIGKVGKTTTELQVPVKYPEVEYQLPKPENLEKYKEESTKYDDQITNTFDTRVFTKEQVEMMAKVVYREAGAVDSDMHKAAVVWCMLNHLDNGFHGDTIEEVITYPNALAYDPQAPVDEDIVYLVRDVISRYNLEREGVNEVGRVLPKDYLYFTGDGQYNHFTNTWPTGEKWDWSLPNPYSS